ncbi:MAG: electron transfer flavoprotein subunit beta/FixA family protein [Gemmatimonadetes bacterium]|nr:electron transfer flavoprotein subunit beta/FixA family protein [Gemmatimonadota bacterium]
MKIVVCIKRVPDTESRIRIAGDGQSIDAAGIKFVISPYDEYALETALRLKEAAGTGEVIVLTLGESSAAEQLRSALAMGADRAVLLRATPGFDGLVTATALASEVRAIAPDLVLLGMKAADDDGQQVAPMLAELLDLPCVTVAASLEVVDGALRAHREVEGGVEHVRAPVPAVVSITKGEFEPRYPSLKGIMAAKRKPLEEKEVEVPTSRITLRSLAYPPERAAGKVVGQGGDAVPELVRLLQEEARVL